MAGVQIEVDGGYEGNSTVNLVEAKIGYRNNLNIRQLIYPQLVWEKVINGKKPVKTYICLYEEPVIRFIPVMFDSGSCSADHTQEMSFRLEPEERLNLEAIKPIPNASVPILSAPFPQADRFETVLSMFSIVAREEEIAKELLLLDFDIDPRQIDYYSNAMRWLGLVEIENRDIRLTTEGRRVASLPHAQKIKHMAQIIFSEPIFNYVLHNETSDFPPALFVRWGCNSESTRKRRLQTVKAWISYFKKHDE